MNAERFCSTDHSLGRTEFASFEDSQHNPEYTSPRESMSRRREHVPLVRTRGRSEVTGSDGGFFSPADTTQRRTALRHSSFERPQYVDEFTAPDSPMLGSSRPRTELGVL